MGWLRLVGSLKLYVSLENIGLFYRALLQKRPIISRSLLAKATPYNPRQARVLKRDIQLENAYTYIYAHTRRVCIKETYNWRVCIQETYHVHIQPGYLPPPPTSLQHTLQHALQHTPQHELQRTLQGVCHCLPRPVTVSDSVTLFVNSAPDRFDRSLNATKPFAV